MKVPNRAKKEVFKTTKTSRLSLHLSPVENTSNPWKGVKKICYLRFCDMSLGRGSSRDETEERRKSSRQRTKTFANADCIADFSLHSSERISCSSVEGGLDGMFAVNLET
jgi:hypothetical protein